MRDESDAGRRDVRLAEQPLDGGDDSGCDAFRRVVGRRDLRACDELARGGVDRNDVGERAADVDADA